MPAAGDGYRIHVTGLTHDERGYPDLTVDAQANMVGRIVGKIQNHLDDIIQTESYRMQDAEIALISYGVSGRTALAAVDMARSQGIKAGLLRLLTVWPFPEAMIRSLAGRVKGFVTVEINLGQIHLEVERCAAGRTPAFLVGHAGGTLISPQLVVERIKEAF